MISVDLGIGKASARVWGCDLTGGLYKGKRVLYDVTRLRPWTSCKCERTPCLFQQ